MTMLAREGGSPVRLERLPYAQQWIDDDDIEAVVQVLRSDWLTTGPSVEAFERAFAHYIGCRAAVAVNSGTAALHAIMHAIGIGPGDEVIVPAITFAATANCVLYEGGRPVFTDVEADTLLLDPDRVGEKVTTRTKAIVAVDYAGQPCHYDRLRALARQHELTLVADACHALGADYHDEPAGVLGDLTAFSFHPVKHITCGEGGCVTTDSLAFAERMRRFRNHGITVPARCRADAASWSYEIQELGYNYRLTDFQCALLLSQLGKLPSWLERRRFLAQQYDLKLAALAGVAPLKRCNDRVHAYHLYVVRLDLGRWRASRAEIFQALSAEGIGVNVHYIPVHLHPLYRERLGTRAGDCPVAEAAYESLLTLPLYPKMRDQDVDDVVSALRKVLAHYGDRVAGVGV